MRVARPFILSLSKDPSPSMGEGWGEGEPPVRPEPTVPVHPEPVEGPLSLDGEGWSLPRT